MEKAILVFRSDTKPAGAAAALVDRLAAALDPFAGALAIHAPDPSATPDLVEALGPLYDPTLWGAASLWLDCLDDPAAILGATSFMGQSALYSVVESAARDYPKAPAGRSPGLTLLALFRRHPSLGPDRFMARWRQHTELSRRIHPLTRYHRNRVAYLAAGEGDAWDGIVEERVARPEDLRPENFYLGEGARELASRDITEFIDVAENMKCALCAEWIVKPPAWL